MQKHPILQTPIVCSELVYILLLLLLFQLDFDLGSSLTLSAELADLMIIGRLKLKQVEDTFSIKEALIMQRGFAVSARESHMGARFYIRHQSLDKDGKCFYACSQRMSSDVKLAPIASLSHLQPQSSLCMLPLC